MLFGIIPILARTATIVGVNGAKQVATNPGIRSKVFEGLFKQVLKRSQSSSIRIDAMLNSEQGLWATITKADLKKWAKYGLKSANYAARYVISDVYADVQSLDDNEFRKLLLKLKGNSDLSVIAENINLSVVGSVATEIPYIKELAAAGVALGVSARAVRDPKLFKETVGHLDFGGASLRFVNSDLRLSIAGKEYKVDDTIRTPVFFASLMLQSYTANYGSDVQVAGFPEADSSEFAGIQASPRYDRKYDLDEADLLFERVQERSK